MKRRDFLKSALILGAGLAIAPGLTCKKVAEAAWNPSAMGGGTDPLLGIPITETHLSFRSLENRRVTDGIVVHHIGNTNRDVSAAEVHRWHLANGWAGIGYHFLIRKDGTIERGRPMEMVGAHCYNQNDHTIGVNIVGNFMDYEPTSLQLHSAEQLLAALCRYYRLTPNRETIVGHREYCSTLCPGDNLYAELDDLVANVAKIC